MQMGYREYARHRGVALRAVQKAIEAGRIRVNENKKIDSEQADRDWDANTDIGRVAMSGAAGPARHGRSVSAQAQAPLSLGLSDDEDGDDETPAVAGQVPAGDQATAQYRAARTMKEEYRAKTEKVEYDRLIGKVIDVDDAKRIAYTAFRTIRDSIMNVAPRLKDLLAAETDAHACEVLIENELTAALRSIDVSALLVDQDDE